MRYYLLSILCVLTISASGQTLTKDRYKSSVFDVQVLQDVQYGSAPQWIWPYWSEDLYLNIHDPLGDLNMNRPLIIFAHSGGFLNGSKDVDNMGAICDTFARKGFVTATIDYRKGFDPLDAESAERAVYRGIQDGKAAVRFFKQNWDVYNIDTNNIFFGGMSAGGFISLHVAYMDKESERPASTYGGGLVNDLGCLDCAGNNFPHSSKVKGILDFWGAVSDTTIIESGDIPVMIMHGTQDPTVPFNYGHPFGLGTLPVTYGALPVKNQCDFVGVDYEYIVNDMDIHMMEGSSNGTWDPEPNSFWADTLLPFSTNFIFNLIKPNPTKISPDSIFVDLNEVYNLEVSADTGSTYLWDYDQTNCLATTNDSSSTLELQFITPGQYEVKVVEFNHILAASDTLTFFVEVNDDLGIDLQKTSTLSIFPNPSNGQFSVQSDQLINRLEVYDLSGKRIMNLMCNSNKMDVSTDGLSSGVYMIHAHESGRISKAKLIVQ